MFFKSKDKKDERNSSDSGKNKLSIPTLELTIEREDEIIENLANKIKKYGLEVPAMLLFIPLQPLSPIAGMLGLLPFAPFLEAFNLPGFDYAAFISKPENITKLLKKIEENSLKKEEKEGSISSKENG